MSAAVLLRGGDRLYLLTPGARNPPSTAFASDIDSAASAESDGFVRGLSDPVVRWLKEQHPPEPLPVVGPSLLGALARAGFRVRPTTEDELRGALADRPSLPWARERQFRLLAVRRRVERTLSSDSEVLVALVREEVRVERSLRRELGALDQWLAPTTGPLADQRESGERFREELSHHHAELLGRLEAAARRVLPNLSEVVGARVAARLAAAAGSPDGLARMPAGRLQLLGAKRRPAKDHGPRYGLLYESPSLVELPEDGRARFARSLAALAVIAARADLLTHQPISAELVARRDRRAERLRRRSR